MATLLRMLPAVLLLSSARLTSQAQDATATRPVPYHRWYVGARVGFQAFNTTSVYTAQQGVIRPVYGYLGYQLTPHLAVQAGYMQRNQAGASSFSGINNTGQQFTYTQRDNYYNAAVPVLLRFRLARQPTHRLHLDALLGTTVLLHHFREETSNTVAGQSPAQYQLDLRATNWYITGGVGLGFNLTPHLELTAEATNNWYLNARDSYNFQIQAGTGIGLCYHFSVPKAG